MVIASSLRSARISILVDVSDHMGRDANDMRGLGWWQEIRCDFSFKSLNPVVLKPPPFLHEEAAAVTPHTNTHVTIDCLSEARGLH